MVSGVDTWSIRGVVANESRVRCSKICSELPQCTGTPTDFLQGVAESITAISPTLEQYNALLTKATTPNSNIYSPRWEGPPVSDLLEWGQLNALELLNVGFTMPAGRYVRGTRDNLS